jgi:hypothetical protein
VYYREVYFPYSRAIPMGKDIHVPQCVLTLCLVEPSCWPRLSSSMLSTMAFIFPSNSLRCPASSQTLRSSASVSNWSANDARRGYHGLMLTRH